MCYILDVESVKRTPEGRHTGAHGSEGTVEMTQVEGDKVAGALLGMVGVLLVVQSIGVMLAANRINERRLPGEPDFAGTGAALLFVSVPLLFASWGVLRSKRWGHGLTSFLAGLLLLSMMAQGGGTAIFFVAPFALYSVLRLTGTIESEEYRKAKLAASVQSVVAAVATAPVANRLEDLDKLASLRDRSVLTEDEFQLEKRRILTAAPPGRGVGLLSGNSHEAEAQRAVELADRLTYMMSVGQVIEAIGQPESDNSYSDRTRTLMYCSGRLELRFINGCLSWKGVE